LALSMQVKYSFVISLSAAASAGVLNKSPKTISMRTISRPSFVRHAAARTPNLRPDVISMISVPDWRPAKLNRSRARPPRAWPFSPELRSSQAPRHRAGQDQQCRAQTPQRALTRRSRIGSLVGPCMQRRPACKHDQRPWSLSLWLETAVLRVAVLRCSMAPRAGQVLGRDLNCSECCPGGGCPRVRRPLSLRARPALGRPLRSSSSSLGWTRSELLCVPIEVAVGQ